MKDLYKHTILRYILMALTVWTAVLGIVATTQLLHIVGLTLLGVAIILPITIWRADKIARRAYVGLKISKTVAPGELVDRWAINTVKTVKLTGVAATQAREEAQEGWEAIQFLARHFSPRKKEELDVLLHRLRDLNLTQWEFEDQVRYERNWEAAVAARDNNSLRIEVKNLINELFGNRLEHKLYKTKQIEGL